MIEKIIKQHAVFIIAVLILLGLSVISFKLALFTTVGYVAGHFIARMLFK